MSKQSAQARAVPIIFKLAQVEHRYRGVHKTGTVNGLPITLLIKQYIYTWP